MVLGIECLEEGPDGCRRGCDEDVNLGLVWKGCQVDNIECHMQKRHPLHTSFTHSAGPRRISTVLQGELGSMKSSPGRYPGT